MIMGVAIPEKFVQIERRSKLARSEITDFFNFYDGIVREKLAIDPLPIGRLSTRVAGNVLTPEAEPIPDCLTCGICCVALHYASVSSERVPSAEHYWEVTEETSHGEVTVDRVLRRDPDTGACLSLAGEIGKNISCNIYEERPQTCRDFEAGSDKCHALRRAYGLERRMNDFEAAMTLNKLMMQDDPEDAERRIIHVYISEDKETKLMEIKCWLQDMEETVVHQYDPQREAFYEGDFTGLTIAEAENLIANAHLK
jgi:hypothetical protein